MPSTFTVNKSIEQPANGDYVDTWSAPVNADWAIIDKAFGGSLVINVVAASGTIALTLTQYQNLTITFSGLLTSNVNYQIPSGVGGNFYFFNNTTGAFTVTISSAGAGSSIVLPQGKVANAICDGTNVVFPNAPVAPGGSNTQLQYNASGLLAGASNLLFNGSTALAIGTTGTPITATVTGAVVVAGTTSGGSTFAVPAAAATISYILPIAQGSANQLLANDGAGNLSWSTVAAGVTSVSFGTTGLTPSSPTGGAVVVAGTLGTGFGGTGLTTFTAANNAIYSTSASALTAGKLPVAAGGIGTGTPGITAFNNITGLSAAGTTGTTSTNIVFSTSPTLTTPAINGGALDAATTVSDSGTIATNSVGFRGIPQNAQAGGYTLVLTDTGKQIANTTGGWTIPANSGTAFPIGSTVVLYNNSASGQTVAIITDTLRQAGTANTGSRTLAQRGLATVTKIAATEWVISGAGVS